MNYETDRWLREAWPAFAAILACEREEGPPAARERLEACRQAYLGLREADGERPLSEIGDERRDASLARTRGVWVFWMLRRRVGEPLFERLEPEIANVATEGDLCRVIGREIGDDLAPFFDYWVRTTALPEYRITSATARAEGGGFGVTLRVQSRGVDATPVPGGVPIVIRTEEGARHHLPVSLPGGEARDLAYPLVTRPEAVAIDPDLEVLGPHTPDTWHPIRLRRWWIF